MIRHLVGRGDAERDFIYSRVFVGRTLRWITGFSKLSRSVELMHVLPVLDLLNGIVVRGVRGRRTEYRPVVSRLVDRPDALSVARAFRDKLGLTRLYVADLDAILSGRPNREIYRSLADEGFELLVDAGLRDVESAEPILAAGAAQVIAGLETWAAPDELARLCAKIGADRVIFSLDLKQGAPLGDLSKWGAAEPYAIALRAAEAGVKTIIVLDLAQVGAGEGVETAELCRRLLERLPDLRLITGGGVRNLSDLRELSTLGIDGVLVASALHDGRITRDMLEQLARRTAAPGAALT
jgi:phosphoribosylformimino-5-aminoimidazole carboxamide ribotide isomerase